MITYLSGVENKKHRKLMQKVGIKNAALNYTWARRSKKTDWFEELSFLDKLIVDHGFPLSQDVDLYDVDDYLEFLNEHEKLIEFAFDFPNIGDYIKHGTNVKIIPIFHRGIENQDLVAVSRAQFDTPFIGNYLRGLKLHGYNLTKVPINCYSFNTALHLYGKYGYSFYWDGKELQLYNKKKASYRSFVARKMITEGHELDYLKILKNDAEAVNKMNIISWRLFAESGEND